MPKVEKCALCGANAENPGCDCCRQCGNPDCPQHHEGVLTRNWNRLQRAINAIRSGGGKVLIRRYWCPSQDREFQCRIADAIAAERKEGKKPICSTETDHCAPPEKGD
jgi:hypothetical protein